MNVSYASPAASAVNVAVTAVEGGLLRTVWDIYGSLSGWSIALTVLLLLVAYDQCTPILHGSRVHVDS